MDIAKLQAEHDAAVKQVQESVAKFHKEKKSFRVYHGSTSSTRPMQFDRDAIVDTSPLNRIYPVDKESMTVKAEPNVPMDALAAHCIAVGVVPKIVMEFKGITCGGGFSGMSGESNMYRYGLFHNTVTEIEIILGDGTLEYANREKNVELLQEAAGSLGTFGIVTLITIELLPATSHVQLQIVPVSDPKTIPLDHMEKACSDPSIDYIDGIYFNARSGVVMYGKRIDYAQRDPRAPLLTTKQIHWFADTIEAHLKKHNNQISTLTNAEAKGGAAKTKSSGSTGTGEVGDVPPVLLTLTDYLFRYDHGAFWGGKLAFKKFKVPQNRITRAIADPFMDSRQCKFRYASAGYAALHRTGLADEYVVQDFGQVASGVVQFIEYVAANMPDCQIFLCPLRPAADINIDKRFHDKVMTIKNERIFGVGVYGKGPSVHDEFVALNRALEYESSRLLGSKLLYARTYFTEEEFWTIYSKSYYDECRSRWRASGLPSIYDKLHADMNFRRKRRPVRGIVETMLIKMFDVGRKDYLLKAK